ERMAVRADFDLQVVAEGRARGEGIPAAASDGDVFVIGVDGFFHGVLAGGITGGPVPQKGAQCSGRAEGVQARGELVCRLEKESLSGKGLAAGGSRRTLLSFCYAMVKVGFSVLSTKPVDNSVDEFGYRGSRLRKRLPRVNLLKK